MKYQKRPRSIRSVKYSVGTYSILANRLALLLVFSIFLLSPTLEASAEDGMAEPFSSSETTPLSADEWIDQIWPRIGIGVQEEYTDNLFLVDSNREDDWITRFNSSFLWGRKGPRWQVSAEYTPQYIHYEKHQDKDEWIHTGRLTTNLILIRDLLSFDVSDTYSRVSISSRRQREDISSFVGQIDRNILILRPTLRKNISRTLSFDASYEYTDTQYIQSGGVDRYSHGASATLSRRVTPRLSGSLLYRFKREVPRGDLFSPFTRHEAGGRVEYQIGGAISTSAEGGLSSTDFEDSGTDRGAFWDATVSYGGATPYRLSYRYRQSFESSVEAGIFSQREHEVRMAYSRRIRADVSLFKTRGAYKEINRRDISEGIRYNLGIPVGSSITLDTGGEWSRSDFDPENERVIRRLVTVTIDTMISRIFNLSIGYRYATEDSREDQNDFENNFAFVRLGAQF